MGVYTSVGIKAPPLMTPPGAAGYPAPGPTPVAGAIGGVPSFWAKTGMAQAKASVRIIAINMNLRVCCIIFLLV
jgi:hypothetical protein